MGNSSEVSSVLTNSKPKHEDTEAPMEDPMNTDTREQSLILNTERVRRHRGPQRKTARNEAFAAAYNAGASPEDLAKMFNLKPNTVEQYLVKFRRWGLITRPTTSQRVSGKAERNAAIVKDYRAGTSVSVLAQKYALSAMQVRNVVHEAEAREQSQVDTDPWVHAAFHLSVVEDITTHGTEALLRHQREVIAAMKASLAAHHAAA